LCCHYCSRSRPAWWSLGGIGHLTMPLNYSLERTRTSRSGRFEFVAQWRLVRAAQPGRSAMPRCVAGVFNPEGWHRAAGGRSRAQTPGRESVGSVHPEGMLEFCDPLQGRLEIYESLDRGCRYASIAKPAVIAPKYPCTPPEGCQMRANPIALAPPGHRGNRAPLSNTCREPSRSSGTPPGCNDLFLRF
jgi:hypothetical protein